VVVADDEPHVVAYLETVLHLEGFDVAGSAGDADGVVQLAYRLRPDVALLDLHMPGGGLEAAQLIGSLSPETRILIFSAEADGADVVPLLRSGIDGYVLKGCAPDRLAEAIRSVVAGGSFMAPEVNRVAMDELTARLHHEEQDTRRTSRQRDRIADVISTAGFTVVLQPIIDLADGRTTAVEALARFTGTAARTPELWFAEAEDVGLRTTLELAVASTALGQLRLLRDEISMMVNLSPSTVLSGRLVEILTGVALERVVIELTEHAPVGDYQALDDALRPWRSMGARLAVDDAGGGYASFAHILNLNPDLIKLDTTLTVDIHTDGHRRALARALVGFARELDIGVIAEGVEGAAELEVLRELGTPFAQGFHLGRPRPLSEQPDLLRTEVRGAGLDLSTEPSALIDLGHLDRQRAAGILSPQPDP
jgi:EAL domain-containing protein (putative c-di-GMP-specific phosphodiesterase class I)/AmiR/NasT family two-component response regulator